MVFLTTYAVGKKIVRKTSKRFETTAFVLHLLETDLLSSIFIRLAKTTNGLRSTWDELRSQKRTRPGETKSQARLAMQCYLASLTVSSFVTVTMSSFPVTPFTVTITVTLFSRRPIAVTIPAI